MLALVLGATTAFAEEDPTIDPNGSVVEASSDQLSSDDAISEAVEAATTAEGDARVEAVQSLWKIAADQEFENQQSVNALQELAGDEDVRVSLIAQKALDDMDSQLAE